MGEVIFNGKNYYMPDTKSQRALLDAGIYTFRYYPQENLMICTDVFIEMFGCPRFVSGMPKSLADMLILEDDWEKLFGMHEKLIDGEAKTTEMLRTKDGRVMSRVSITVIERDSEGRADVCFGMVEPLDMKVTGEQLLGVLSSDYKRVYYVDFIANQILPYRLSPVIEKEYGEYFRSKPRYDEAIRAYIDKTVHPDDREEMYAECSYENINKQLENNSSYFHDYKGLRDGNLAYFRMKVAKLSETKNLSYAVFGFSEITEEKSRELDRYAYIDDVTGGDNYSRFKEKLVENGEKGYLLSMDLHSFRIVNEVCGIQRGDEVLRAVWNCLRDTISANDIASHINADHFSVFIKTDSQEIVTKRMNRISEELVKLSAQMDVPLIKPYFGVTLWNPEVTIEQAYGEATTAKHKAKERNTSYEFYSKNDSLRYKREKALEDAFEGALENSEFEIWYQPKYDPSDNSMVGAEALCRWRGKDGGLISPGEFIPLFEKNGQIRQLDEYVFRKVCIQLKKWIEDGVNVIPISINLSRASLFYQNTVEQYKKIAAEIGVPEELVPIEITESAAFANNEVKGLANHFFTEGFTLHLDDFGTGYSSLAALNLMHFDTLKLDKSLVDFIGNYSGDKLLEHVIALAKDLGMHVTAEGVEQVKQVSFLKNLKCDSIQGYYYSKPLPVSDFEKIIGKKYEQAG